MPLQFPVPRGTIVVCDYAGSRPPEMVKRRPVIVLSPRLAHRERLATVVPLSTTPPPANLAYVCELLLSPPLPAPFDAPAAWVKADMLATVDIGRLDLLRMPRGPDGKRRYLRPKVTPADLARIERCVLHALGICS